MLREYDLPDAVAACVAGSGSSAAAGDDGRDILVLGPRDAAHAPLAQAEAEAAYALAASLQSGGGEIQVKAGSFDAVAVAAAVVQWLGKE